jgi:predicted CopG family antitoxin
MKASTLTYIHELLREEVTKRENALEFIRNICSTQSAENLEEEKEKALEAYDQARLALADFESKEWN